MTKPAPPPPPPPPGLPTKMTPPPPPPPAGGKRTKLLARSKVQSAVLRAHELYLRELDASLRDVHERGMMSDAEGGTDRVSDHVSWSHLQRLSAADGWPAQKRAFWERVERRVLRRIEADVVQQEADEIAALSQVRVRALAHALGGEDADGNVIEPAKPKSFEGAVGALVQLDKRIADKRTYVAEFAAGQGAPEPTVGMDVAREFVPAIADAMDEAEVRTLARQLAVGRAAGDVGPPPGTAAPAKAAPPPPPPPPSTAVVAEDDDDDDD